MADNQEGNSRDNMALWNSVYETDKSYTKNFNKKGFSGTAVTPTWVVRQATKTWGPKGIGWGIDVKQDVIDKFEITMGDGTVRQYAIHTIRIELWFQDKISKQRGKVEAYGATDIILYDKRGVVIVEDFRKMSETDAMTKALSHLGFAADIHMGDFGDNKYVRSHSPEVDDSVDQHRRDRDGDRQRDRDREESRSREPEKENDRGGDRDKRYEKPDTGDKKPPFATVFAEELRFKDYKAESHAEGMARLCKLVFGVQSLQDLPRRAQETAYMRLKRASSIPAYYKILPGDVSYRLRNMLGTESSDAKLNSAVAFFTNGKNRDLREAMEAPQAFLEQLAKSVEHHGQAESIKMFEKSQDSPVGEEQNPQRSKTKSELIQRLSDTLVRAGCKNNKEGALFVEYATNLHRPATGGTINSVQEVNDRPQDALEAVDKWYSDVADKYPQEDDKQILARMYDEAFPPQGDEGSKP